MPKLTIGSTTVEVPSGKRLVLAIEDAGVAIGHRCGGQARCTTCRVTFDYGVPEVMTLAEHDKLLERTLLGQVRLSCQVLCEHDMCVRVLMTAADQPEWHGHTGERPAPHIEPDGERRRIEEWKR